MSNTSGGKEPDSRDSADDLDRVNELQRTKLEHECEKLRLEAECLRKEARSSRTLPLVVSVVSSMGAMLGLGVAAWAQMNQLDFQEEQSTRLRSSEARTGLQKAAEMATDFAGGVDRRISGVYQLRPYWNDEDLESVTAATLTSVLTSPRESQNMGFLRCAAAEVIGKAITFPRGETAEQIGGQRAQDKARNKRIARLLYGSPQGEQGLVSKMNHMLSRAEGPGPNMISPEQSRRSPADNLNCGSAVGATVEAIRKNWEYLREVNLQATDLSFGEFYAADLGGTALNEARLHRTNLRCANLANAIVDDFNSADEPLLELANVSGLPKNSRFRRYALQRGAIEIPEDVWQKWRDVDFDPDKARPFLAAAFQGKELEIRLRQGQEYCKAVWSPSTRPARRGFSR